MKRTFAAVIFALLLSGCAAQNGCNTDPVSASNTAIIGP
jgi:hypothetical protein